MKRRAVSQFFSRVYSARIFSFRKRILLIFLPFSPSWIRFSASEFNNSGIRSIRDVADYDDDCNYFVVFFSSFLSFLLLFVKYCCDADVCSAILHFAIWLKSKGKRDVAWVLVRCTPHPPNLFFFFSFSTRKVYTRLNKDSFPSIIIHDVFFQTLACMFETHFFRKTLELAWGKIFCHLLYL